MNKSTTLFVNKLKRCSLKCRGKRTVVGIDILILTVDVKIIKGIGDSQPGLMTLIDSLGVGWSWRRWSGNGR